MGTGNGIQAITAFEAGASRVVAVDIDPEAIKTAKQNSTKKNAVIDFRVSDLFSNIKKSEKFDLIIFNPPYLPKDEDSNIDVDLTGGEIGNELSIEFLKQAKDYLSENGFILLISSSISDPFEIFSNAKIMGYDYEIVEDVTLNMETLYCVKFKPSQTN